MGGIARAEVDLLRRLIREQRLAKADAQQILAELQTARQRDEPVRLEELLALRGVRGPGLDPTGDPAGTDPAHTDPAPPYDEIDADRSEPSRGHPSRDARNPSDTIRTGSHRSDSGSEPTAVAEAEAEASTEAEDEFSTPVATTVGNRGPASASSTQGRVTRPRPPGMAAPSTRPSVRPRRPWLFIITALIAASGALVGSGWWLLQSGQPPSTEPVREVFDQFRQAILDGDGRRAALFLDQATIQRYEDLRYHALMTERAALQRLPAAARNAVLASRTILDRETVLALTGQGLFARFVEQRWIDPAALQALAVGEITITGRTARSAVSNADGEPSEAHWQFTREGRSWKVHALATPALQPSPERLEQVLETTGDEQPLDRVWQPLVHQR